MRIYFDLVLSRILSPTIRITFSVTVHTLSLVSSRFLTDNTIFLLHAKIRSQNIISQVYKNVVGIKISTVIKVIFDSLKYLLCFCCLIKVILNPEYIGESTTNISIRKDTVVFLSDCIERSV